MLWVYFPFIVVGVVVLWVSSFQFCDWDTDGNSEGSWVELVKKW